MFGLSTIASSLTRAAASASNTASRVRSVTVSQVSMPCFATGPSISTSGSTIGTIFCAWHSAA